MKIPIEFDAEILKISMTYVLADLDNMLVGAVQEAFAASAPGAKVIRVQTGHCSFLAMPKKICGIIVQAAYES